MVDHRLRRRVVVSVHWQDGPPMVRVFDDGAADSTMVCLLGLRLNYRTHREATRRCLGRATVTVDGAAHVDCTESPLPGQRKCTRCSIADSTFASNLHHAHTRDRATLDPAFLVHLAKPTVLYLAAFRDGSIKVGTSAATRGGHRLAEQGAWRARFVAEASDGYAVREVEDRITAELGLPQAISTKRKLDGMVHPMPDERLDEQLLGHTHEVHELLEVMADSRLSPANTAWVHPHADHPAWGRVHRYPLDLATGCHDLEVVAAVGRFVAVQRPGFGDVFVADLQQLYGIELELGDFPSDELAVQDSLF